LLQIRFQGKPHQRGVKYTGVWKIGDFRVIFDGNRRLSYLGNGAR